MKNLLLFIVLQIYILPNVVSQTNDFVPVVGDFSFKPGLDDNSSLWMKNVNSKLQTNVKDVPMSYQTDSLYVLMNIAREKDSGGWYVSLIHYTGFDKTRMMGTGKPKTFNRMFPIELEFDSSFQFIGLLNWEWWRDQHLNNLAKEAAGGKIDSAVYSKFFNLYNDRDYLEKSVLGSYLDFFELFGRTINLWYEHPVMRALEIPFNYELIDKAGTEKAYNPQEAPSLIYHYSVTQTDEEDFQVLAEAYINNIKNMSEEQKANFALPRIIIKETTFHSYNIYQKLFTYFKFEREINNNGSKLIEEDQLSLLLIKD